MIWDFITFYIGNFAVLFSLYMIITSLIPDHSFLDEFSSVKTSPKSCAHPPKAHVLQQFCKSSNHILHRSKASKVFPWKTKVFLHGSFNLFQLFFFKAASNQIQWSFHFKYTAFPQKNTFFLWNISKALLLQASLGVPMAYQHKCWAKSHQSPVGVNRRICRSPRVHFLWQAHYLACGQSCEWASVDLKGNALGMFQSKNVFFWGEAVYLKWKLHWICFEAFEEEKLKNIEASM